MTTETALGVAVPRAQSFRRMVIAATIGNVLEWCDFVAYTYFAVTISQVFFPTGNSTASLLITFGTFGLAYFARPIGALLIGNYTDRRGRKAGLTLSIGLMMVGTTLMALTPSYAAIGVTAPILITLARLLQGFSVGGEFGSAVSFLMEHGSHRRGFAASWQWASVGIISIIVSLFGIVLTTVLTHDQLTSWGWRLIYLFGMLIGPVGLYIRSQVSETPEFLEAKKTTSMPISELVRRYPAPVLLAFGASIISNSSYYLLAYIPTYGVKQLHLPAYTGFVATFAGGVMLAIFSLVAGHLSDRGPRPRIMLITGWLFLLTAYPSFYLMAMYPSLTSCIIAVAWLNLVKAGYSGVLPSLLGEQFPVEVRAIGVALSFSTAVSIFGGLAPFFATWLIAQTGDNLSPSYYLMFTAALSIIALMVIGRRSRAQPTLAMSTA
jgi:MFS transporter, MHS family, proline/betaine transporter